jgi:hypothetical protein
LRGGEGEGNVDERTRDRDEAGQERVGWNMNDRYERIGEAREQEFPDEPVHAPEFGNAAGHAVVNNAAGVESYPEHVEQYQDEQYPGEQYPGEQYQGPGSANGTEPDNGYAPSADGAFATQRGGHGPQAFEEPSSPLLLEMNEIEDFKRRWPEIKATFVDDPRDSVQLADQMLSQVTDLIARRVGEERARLESEWNGRNDVTTEDLRQSLHRYQVFFDRLTNT